MGYDPNIPQPTHTPAQDVNGLLTNFTQLNSQFSIEHTQLNPPGATGKHKYVTLIRSPGAPAPIGNDWRLTHEYVTNTNCLILRDSAALDQYIPVRRQLSNFGVNIGDTNFFNLATLGNQHIGTVLVVDHNQRDRSIFTTYNFVSPNANVPGTAGQLISGGVFTKIKTSGTNLTLESTQNRFIDVIITYSFY